ncbi:hypothetical protein L7F22_065969 [Adiantum nelumboides]|nr:hypothetical protein [Adiantum nelumboides]MCO5611711.1 hypothetical protein [Adiantum nelumboides]
MLHLSQVELKLQLWTPACETQESRKLFPNSKVLHEMRRLACKIVMDLTSEQRLRLDYIGATERQRNHSLAFPDSHPSPTHGTDWTLRRCCTQSIAREPEFVDYVDKVAAHLTYCKRETTDGALGTCNMPDTTAHLANCGRVDFWGTPGTSREIACHRFDVSDYSTEVIHDVSSMGHLDKATEKALHVQPASVCEADTNSEATISSRDEIVEPIDDGLRVSTQSALDYMEECWDEALEQAMVEASDSCMHKRKMEGFCEVDPRVETMNEGGAKTDFQAEPFCVSKCKDEVLNDTALNTFSNGIRPICNESPVKAVERSSKHSIDRFEELKIAADCNSHPLSSFLEEDFINQNNCTFKEAMNEFSDENWSSDSTLKFSKQQMEVLEAVACGKSVFITGSAGTGKSFLLMYIIRILKRALPDNSVFVTASTGIAACTLKGITLHTFAGIGLGGDAESSLAMRVLRNKDSSKRWRQAAVLIIDEISMIDGELFDKLDYIAKRVRGSTRCFGGIQLIVTGDFFQLPPVNPPNLQKFFAFQADCWNRCFQMQVELEHVFRQSDSVFVKILNEIRKGVHTCETHETLEMCYRALPDDGTGIVPTRLYPLKTDVRQENMEELRALQASIVTFFAVDSQTDDLHRYTMSSMRSEKELQLCVGAQVMLTKNLDTKIGLVNGAKGVVAGFQSQHNMFCEGSKDEKAVKRASPTISPSGYWPIVRFDCGTNVIGPAKDALEDGGVEVASRIQVPLILAWALSVHKCQGMTLSKVQTDLSKAFDYGMVYVALSRVKDLNGLQLVGYDPTRIKAHPKVIAFSKSMFQRACCLI